MMKKLMFLLLFPVVALAQNDTFSTVEASKISVVSVDEMNVVYRGVSNPISIAVNNAKSYTISGDGVILQNGKYVLKPGVGTETKVIVEIENFDGSKVTEEHFFRIKGLPGMMGLINDSNCYNCLIGMSRKELEKAKISTEMYGFLLIDRDSDFFKVNSFEVKFSENKVIEIEGNTFNKEINREILKLKKGDIFEINIRSYGPPTDGLKRKVPPLKVILAD